MRILPPGTILCLLAAGGLAAGAEPPRVALVATPGGGVQPQAAVGEDGTIHVVYLKGDPAAADVFHATWGPDEPGFGPPARIGDGRAPGVALGTVRGAQIAIGRGGRVHVAWNGSSRPQAAKPAVASLVVYASSGPGRAGFGPPRNVLTGIGGLDGGATVAADAEGTVIVACHGWSATDPHSEAGRRPWVARSEDDGATFGEEGPAWNRPTGACACCGTKAVASGDGSFRMLYRAASGGGAGRDMILLTSRDRGRTFQGIELDPWRINACPMSTASLSRSEGGVAAAWETRGQVRFARLDRPGDHFGPAGGEDGGRKHPSVATNREGLTLLAWAEGTGWQKGGRLAWQVFDRSGRPVGEAGRLERGVPVWGLPAAVARADGSFAIIH